MIIAGTGHRPDKLFSSDPYGYDNFILLVRFLQPILRKAQPEWIISGMAQGYDWALAMASKNVGIPFVAAIPCEGHEKTWPKEAQKNYHSILKHASEIEIVCKQAYDNTCMQRRNEWMVDNCDTVLALHDGSPGGTGNCVAYALKKKKKVVNVWDLWMVHNEEEFKL